MGVDYRQYCMIGIELNEDDYRKIIQEPVYEKQARYDIKTGIIKYYESVLVKERESVFQFDNIVKNDFWSFYEELEVKYSNLDIDVLHDDDNNIFMGYHLCHSLEFGRVTMLEDSITVEGLVEKYNELKTIFPNKNILVHFFSVIS